MLLQSFFNAHMIRFLLYFYDNEVLIVPICLTLLISNLCYLYYQDMDCQV